MSLDHFGMGTAEYKDLLHPCYSKELDSVVDEGPVDQREERPWLLHGNGEKPEIEAICNDYRLYHVF